MRIYYVLIGLMLSIELYGETLKPCEMIGANKIIKSIAMSNGKIRIPLPTAKREQNLVKVLKKCIHTAAVCFAEVDIKDSRWTGSKSWINDKLIAPNDGDFDPIERKLIFGLLQYVDKTSEEGLCIVAGNGFSQVTPWYGNSWVVTDEGIKQYEIYSSQFTTVMTPNSLYKTMLETHRKAVINAKRDELEKEKKIERAQKMLDEGSDPDFVSELTGISRKDIWLLQRLNN